MNKFPVALIAALALGGLVNVSSAVAATHPVAKAKAKAKVAAPAVAAVAPATEEQLAAAERVFYGNYECEFQKTAQVSTLPKYPGYVEVHADKLAVVMKPVLSQTGAIRLEDPKGRYLVIQIAAKSMLMDVKSGHRVLDGCVSAAQHDLMAKQAEAVAAAAAAAQAASAPAAAPAPEAAASATSSK